MLKKFAGIGTMLLMLLTLGGCSDVGEKAATMSAIYMATSFLSLALLLGYVVLIKKKDPWFIVLFSAVTVVNIGYLSLSISSTLQEALLSNRIAYLGSVFLPLSMLMSILRTCKVNVGKWMVGVLLGISVLVFIIAASPGYLDIYYKEVSLVTVGEVTTLEKVYGPLHSVYLYYLLGYFAAMIGFIVYARLKKKIQSSVRAVILLSSVFVNIGVWLMEQLVKMDFEFLSVSYIVSELFLLTTALLVQDIKITNNIGIKIIDKTENPEDNKASIVSVSESADDEKLKMEKAQYLNSVLHTLTPTEKQVYKLYLEGNNTKAVMAELNITENTLKYHNRNIYSKLGVVSRKELIEISKIKILVKE